MSRRRNARAVAVLLLCAALTLPAGLARAADTAAVAVNTRDGSSVFRLAFSVQRILQPVVDESNAAVAVASCTDCQTVAISLQAVLVFSDPDTVTTENLALAMNVDCTSCDTLASAYQWVLGSGGIVRFTPEGQRRIAEIRTELYGLRTQELSITEIQARVDILAEELERVLAEELVLVRALEEASASPSPDATEPGADGGSEVPTESASPTETASPDETASPTESASPAEDPSVQPTPAESGA